MSTSPPIAPIAPACPTLNIHLRQARYTPTRSTVFSEMRAQTPHESCLDRSVAHTDSNEPSPRPQMECREVEDGRQWSRGVTFTREARFPKGRTAMDQRCCIHAIVHPHAHTHYHFCLGFFIEKLDTCMILIRVQRSQSGSELHRSIGDVR